MQSVLIDTIPLNSFKPDTLNYGYEAVSQIWGLQKYSWRDHLTDVKYLCFNVTYPLYVLNIAPFLRRNGIEALKSAREAKHQPRVIVGGAGVSNLRRDCLSEIADAVFYGELDAENAPGSPEELLNKMNGECWSTGVKHLLSPRYSATPPLPYRRRVLDTPPIIKENAAVLELTRGCPHRCAFCEYSWEIGQPYREKDPQVVFSQLDDLLSQYPSLRRKGLTMRTSSLGSYRYLHEVSEALCERNIKVPWADVNPQDFLNVCDLLKPLGITRLHLGVESFTESVRMSAGKRVTDDQLALVLRLAMQSCYWLHINLIFGLPGEDAVDPMYQRWFDWVRRIDAIRKKIQHKIRIDFLITNFEPSCGTPYECASAVDFDLKDNYFLPKWISLLQELGFYTLGKRQRIWYGSDFGRHGRKKLAHELIMAIRHGGVELTDAICDAFPSGVRRYVTDKQARGFLDRI